MTRTMRDLKMRLAEAEERAKAALELRNVEQAEPIMAEVRHLRAQVAELEAADARERQQPLTGRRVAGGVEPGFSFVKAIRGLATGQWDPDVRAALYKGDEEAGGYLVGTEVAAEIIDLLRPKLAVGSLPGVTYVYPTRVGTLRIPRQGSSATAYWLGELSDIPLSQLAFDAVELSPHKLAALVAISNELLADATPSVEEIVRNDLARTLAATADLGFLRGSGTANQPLGIRNQAGVQTVSMAEVADLYDALVEALTAVQAADANPTGWIAHPRARGVLMKLKDNDGRPIFVTDMTTGPRDYLFGLPVIYSSLVPTNLGVGQNETEIYCVDGTQVVLAIWQQLSLAASGEAAVVDGGSVVSAFQRDMTLVRAIMRVDVGLRHPAGVAVLTGITLS